MRLAEELYQAGVISYPRTETDMFDQQYELQVGWLGGRKEGSLLFRPGALSSLWGGTYDSH